MDESTQSALLCVALHVPVTLVGAFACCCRHLATLLADTSLSWSYIYNLHFCSTQEAIDRIVPTDGSFWTAGRFRTAYLEQYMLQCVSFTLLSAIYGA
jgi:hypothetical protein